MGSITFQSLYVAFAIDIMDERGPSIKVLFECLPKKAIVTVNFPIGST